MVYHRAVCLVLCALLLLGVSCAKLGETDAGVRQLALEKVDRPDVIPVNWGKLVAVSAVAGLSDWAQLWLQDDAGTIRIVPYNVSDNYLSGQARVIRRD